MSKPTLIILSSTPKTAQRLLAQYREIFEGFIEIQGYCFEELHGTPLLTADLVLISYYSIAEEAMKYIAPGVKTLIIQRSISFDSFKLLYDIPIGSRVIIANMDKENTLDALEQIQSLGINHLNFVPYYPAASWPEGEYRYAVVFDEDLLSQVKNLTVINLGVRISSITTCILVAQHFHIREILQKKIEASFMKVNIRLAYAYFEQLKKSQELHKNLQTFLNYYERSILLMDSKGQILFCNYRASRLLNIVDGMSPYNEFFLDHFLAGETGFFMEIEDHSYYVEFYFINGNTSAYIIIDDMEDIEAISKKYRDLLKANGLVAEYSFHDIICKSAVMKNLIKRAQQFAKSDSTIYITGESGCGKELLAQAIHNASKRRQEAFVAVNFAALSTTLNEAELFGYVEGAFTGAKKSGKKGLFELANKGTIFLDEIGDCSSDIQKKILRVIQEKKVMPVGSNKWIPIDIRIISATNQDLRELVAAKKFREDLYYRLNVLPLTIPPLRERREDILLLFYSFLNNTFNIQLDNIGREIEDALLSYDWRGNVRELRSITEYIANCLSAHIENWQDEVLHMLSPVGKPAAFNVENEHILKKLETICELNSILAVLRTLNTPPCLWTRKILSQKFPELGESVIKKIILTLGDYELAVSKKGKGTYISTRGREFLRYVESL